MINKIISGLWITAALTSSVSAEGDTKALFEQVSSLPVYKTLPADTVPNTYTVAEIAAASKDGKRLYFTDSPNNALVAIDITDASHPTALGRINLIGEPTSVATASDTLLVAVNTSVSYSKPSGHIAVIEEQTRRIKARCKLQGQPDSVAVSPDGKYLLVAIENERDEGTNSGVLPQSPAGFASILDLDSTGMPLNCADPRTTNLSGFATVAPDDPEPEYVSINQQGLGVITLQENNHLVILDVRSGELISEFSAGTVDLKNVPISKTKKGSLKGLKREPDAVVWLDEDRFVTANEGDYEGGSRGFTIFHKEGHVVFDAGDSFEQLALDHKLYPFNRADKRGTEPEGVTAAVFQGTRLIFVNSERADFVAVYRDTGGAPEFVQLLKTPPKPEGILAIPERGLLVVTSEGDEPKKGKRAAVALYQIKAH